MRSYASTVVSRPGLPLDRPPVPDGEVVGDLALRAASTPLSLFRLGAFTLAFAGVHDLEALNDAHERVFRVNAPFVRSMVLWRPAVKERRHRVNRGRKKLQLII